MDDLENATEEELEPDTRWRNPMVGLHGGDKGLEKMG